MQQSLPNGQTVGTDRGSEGDWLAMEGEKRYPPLPLLDREKYLVSFEGADDCWNPQNWTSWKK